MQMSAKEQAEFANATVTIAITSSVRQAMWIKREAEARGTSKSQIVRSLIDAEMERREKGEAA